MKWGFYFGHLNIENEFIGVDMPYTYSDMKVGLPIGNGGNVLTVYDEKCIKQSIMAIFSTVSLERVRNPIGSNLLRLLFQPINQDTARRIRYELMQVIERWEPRVEVTNFSIQPDIGKQTYDVSVTYSIRNLGKTDSLRTGLRSFA